MTKVRRISTDSIELALEQLVRTRTSGTKASIKPLFVMEVLKELINYRREEALILEEVDELFCGGDLLTVDEVETLSELGNSSYASDYDLHKIEWGLPEDINELEALDESDVTHEVHQRPVLRTKHSSSKVMGIESRWDDGSSTKRVVILSLLVVIIFTFGTLLLY